MKVSSSWLNKWLRRTMLNGRDIADALERAGLEVEQINESTEIDKRVVVCSVKKVVQHPDANRLKIVDVETGEGKYRIVCGATNVRAGMKAALAQIGARLPGGERIEKAKLRGEVSEGMLCSARELNIGSDHNGILEVSSDVPDGTPLCDIYPADTVIDIKTPANRSDVQSVAGLAREVAAMTKAQAVGLPDPLTGSDVTAPAVEKGAQAGRYMLARVSVKAGGVSPRDLQAHLNAAGVRSLGAVVDATNYVMLDLGQPLHSFDAAKVKLPVAVRYARAGEKLTTLDGVERKLTAEDLVIADQRGPIALAGLMGGADTEVDAGTTEVLVEAAVFDGTTVRKMAKRHGLRTEASARFERGLPVELSPIAMRRAVELLGEVAEGKLLGLADQQNVSPRPRSIRIPLPRLVGLLGFDISHKEAGDALGRLQIPVGNTDKDQIEVPQVPWWRADLALGEDLVEEVIRVVGYDRMPSTIPAWRPQRVEFDRVRAVRRRVRDFLYAAGLFEVMTYSFVSRVQLEEFGLDPSRHLKLKNPLTSEQGYLRSTLLPSQMAVLARNRTYSKDVGFYEISNVFVKMGPGEQPDEPVRLAVTVNRPMQAYATVKGVLDGLASELGVELAAEPATPAAMAPGRAATLLLGKAAIGYIGQVHPERLRAAKVAGEAAYFEVDLSPLMAAYRVKQFAGARRFPATLRDLTVTLPTDANWQAVSDALDGFEASFVSDYYGAELTAGHKVMTVRLVLAHPERTPTDVEATAMEAAAMGRLERKLGAKRRS